MKFIIAKYLRLFVWKEKKSNHFLIMSSLNQKIISVIIPFYNEQIELPSIVKDINKEKQKLLNYIKPYKPANIIAVTGTNG